MIIYKCSVCDKRICKFSDGKKEETISHGLCRFHFLEAAVEEGLATPEEVKLYNAMKQERKGRAS